MISLKEHVEGLVNFEYYRDGNLYYSNSKNLIFPVPISDIGNATFLKQDKALLFMRYIRKHLDTLNEAKNENNT